ncbi:glycosyl hydrolase family 17 protein [Namhaeicola litoreus]|uniref:Endo-1,3-beta-glucanase btgC n=1 Tax=Namhaeicola litoreus TaxID=1052145 RepID=A0ABW3Y699_9FLAO
MKKTIKIVVGFFIMILVFSCSSKTKKENNSSTVKEHSNLSAKDILGNPKYLAMAYGGYRHVDHDIEPTIDELKEDMKLLSSMGVGIIRTYKVHLPHASNVLKAISELKKEDPNFEMYVMLGAWIDCKNAWTDIESDHNVESEANKPQIEEAVRLANEYPDIVKIIAVGNEAMVKWAAEYYVQPGVILKWVTYLQNLKKTGKLDKDLWITSSDNFASWGGGEAEYRVEDLEKLIKAVDYISMHTYPFLDSHYNPSFWKIPEEGQNYTDKEKIDASMLRAKEFMISQYQSVHDYVKSLGIDKPIHIGETGWSSASHNLFGPEGSKAADEYKGALYYNYIRDWSSKEGISCFYFEAFDEPWKDANNPLGEENHFGLFTVDGQAKYALWKMVDIGTFAGLTRGGRQIKKTYNGDKDLLMKDVLVPPMANETKAIK